MSSAEVGHSHLTKIDFCELGLSPVQLNQIRKEISAIIFVDFGFCGYVDPPRDSFPNVLQQSQPRNKHDNG